MRLSVTVPKTADEGGDDCAPSAPEARTDEASQLSDARRDKILTSDELTLVSADGQGHHDFYTAARLPDGPRVLSVDARSDHKTQFSKYGLWSLTNVANDLAGWPESHST